MATSERGPNSPQPFVSSHTLTRIRTSETMLNSFGPSDPGQRRHPAAIGARRDGRATHDPRPDAQQVTGTRLVNGLDLPSPVAPTAQLDTLERSPGQSCSEHGETTFWRQVDARPAGGEDLTAPRLERHVGRSHSAVDRHLRQQAGSGDGISGHEPVVTLIDAG